MKNHLKISLHEHVLGRDTVIVFNVSRDAKKVAHPCSNSYYYPYSVIGYRSVDKEPEPAANVDRKAKPLLYMCGYPYILLYFSIHFH